MGKSASTDFLLAPGNTPGPSVVFRQDVIELLVIGATLTIAAWATGAQAHRRGAASRALDAYALSRGLVFTPAPSSPRGASPRATGSKDDIAFTIDLHRLGGDVRTRVACTVVRGRAPVLSVLQRGVFSSKAEAFRIGDVRFDSAYLVTTGAAEDAEGLRLVTRSLLLLANRCSGVWLHSDGLRVTISWLGFESDPLVLDAARDAVVMVAAWHRPDSPYR